MPSTALANPEKRINTASTTERIRVDANTRG
jgi:hypothetical protein